MKEIGIKAETKEVCNVKMEYGKKYTITLIEDALERSYTGIYRGYAPHEHDAIDIQEEAGYHWIIDIPMIKSVDVV